MFEAPEVIAQLRGFAGSSAVHDEPHDANLLRFEARIGRVMPPDYRCFAMYSESGLFAEYFTVCVPDRRGDGEAGVESLARFVEETRALLWASDRDHGDLPDDVVAVIGSVVPFAHLMDGGECCYVPDAHAEAWRVLILDFDRDYEAYWYDGTMLDMLTSLQAGTALGPFRENEFRNGAYRPGFDRFGGAGC